MLLEGMELVGSWDKRRLRSQERRGESKEGKKKKKTKSSREDARFVSMNRIKEDDDRWIERKERRHYYLDHPFIMYGG
jgi:hypothetical protein